jgi:MFS transporter, UMF1 family
MIALLAVQFIGFTVALFFGWLGEQIGAREGLSIGLSVSVVVATRAGFMETVQEFYILAFAIGLAQGVVFSLSRSYFARLIPEGKTAEFFGFYNMIGKFAALLGPFLVAAAALSGSTRSAVAAIRALLLPGALILVLNRNDDAPRL